MAVRLAAGLYAGDRDATAHETEIPIVGVQRPIELMNYTEGPSIMITDNMEDRTGDKVMTKLQAPATGLPERFSARETQRKRIGGMHKDAKSA